MNKKITWFLILTMTTWLTWTTFTSSIEPVISTEISLQQLANTTEAHVINRTYQHNGIMNIINSPITPSIVTLVLIALFFGENIINKKKES